MNEAKKVAEGLDRLASALHRLNELVDEREPTDDDIYNGYGREGGIAYAPDDQPGSLGENDPRLGFAW